MNICYGSTGWAYFFSLCEIMMVLAIAFFYTKMVYQIYKNEDFAQIEFLDWILIVLSILQIQVMIISFVFGFYYGFTVIEEVLKFSQNSLIGGILLYQILIWNRYAINYDFVKYFIVGLLIVDLFAFFTSLLNEYSFFDLNTCRSNTLIILIIIAFVFNLLIILFAVYRNVEEENSENKSLNILVEDQHNLNDLIQKFATNIKKMKKYYLIMLIIFTMSFFTDIYFKLVMTGDKQYVDSSECIGGSDNLLNNYTINSNNYTICNNTINNYHNKTNKNVQLTCSYYGDLKEEFYFKEYLTCLISFFFHCIGPHIYIYLALFIYKPNINSRSSSFIELI